MSPVTPDTTCSACHEPIAYASAGLAHGSDWIGDGYVCSAVCAYRDALPYLLTGIERRVALHRLLIAEPDAATRVVLAIECDDTRGEYVRTVTAEVVDVGYEELTLAGLDEDGEALIGWDRITDGRVIEYA
ncbi:MAG: hypothetical protein LC798_15415 [Chloroflexi bacterium]|nr:hypothetical protein [Chloroflexota bacterium]